MEPSPPPISFSFLDFKLHTPEEQDFSPKNLEACISEPDHGLQGPQQLPLHNYHHIFVSEQGLVRINKKQY